MKISLALGQRQTLSRQSAWGCLTSNFAVPGLGSLMAGRRTGYLQLAIGVAGLAITLVATARFFGWYVANYSRLKANAEDPFAALSEILHAIKWPCIGLAIFGLAWLWALCSSYSILQEAKRAESQKPPRLDA